jgi:hypothetical protein
MAKHITSDEYTGPERRKSGDRRNEVVDRRSGLDPRGGKTLRTGLERRRGPGRRRTDFAKSAEEGEMTDEQFLFITAIDAYKRANGKPFPTWTEVLEVIRKLGYRKTMACELNLPNAEDWIEAPDTPSNVDKPAEEGSEDDLAELGEW